MDSDQFLKILFDQCEGVVVTCNAEEGFKARRWRSGKVLKGVVYYCISTVQDSAPRDDVLPRQAANLVKTYAIVLDDVGTKVDKAALKGKLAPTMKLRTSMPVIKGKPVSNEQWVYVFVEGVEPARAAALVEALAQAGLTDAGARRADRIMRLPGSLNEKYSPPFATVVLEAHPDRLYTFSEVCAGLGVTPSDTPPLSAGPMALPDGMIDPIDAWNHDHDRVTGPLNARGWYAVTCPLEHEHTGQVDHGADYKPGLPGIFKCQHEHKGHAPLTTAWYRLWIREQDPGADLSLVPRQALQELAGKLAAALGVKVSAEGGGSAALSTVKGADRPAGSAMTQEAYNALEAQLAGGKLFRPGPAAFDLRAAILGDLIHVASEDRYWSIETKCLISYKAVDERWFSFMLPSGMLDRVGKDGEPISPMSVTNWLKWQPDTQRVARITHRLAEPLIVDDCLNLASAVPGRLEVAGEPEPWLDLISFICKDVEEDVELVLDWMALVVTDWTKKPGWHLLLRGAHGTGKNLALQPLVKYTKPLHHRNVSAADIGGQFNHFLTKRLISVDELKMTSRGSISTHDIYNNVKAWTAKGYDTLSINEKFMGSYEAADRSAWTVTSNATIPLPLEEGDRRFMVIDTPRVPWPIEDYDEVVAWLEAGGNEMVVSWLHRRWDALQGSNRVARLFGRAPDTEAKRDLINASAEGIEGAVRLAIEGQHTKPWPDLMSVEDVIARLKAADFDLITDQAKRQITNQKVAAALKAGGAVKLFPQAVKSGDKAVRLWCMRASKAHSYEALGAGKDLFSVYVAQRSGVIPQGFLKAVKTD